MKTKTFDCVEMKHEAQERIRRELENMTREEELEYWRRIAEKARTRRKKEGAGHEARHHGRA